MPIVPSEPPAMPGPMPQRPPSRWRIARWFQRHPRVLDGGTALVLAALTVIPLFDPGNRHGELGHRADVVGVLLLLAATLPLVLRRAHPVAVFVVVAAATGLFQIIGYPEGASLLPLLVMIYTVASMRPHAVSLRALAFVEVVALPIVWLSSTRPNQDGPLLASIVTNGIVLAVPWVLGENVYHRRRSFADLRERAERAERDQAVEAQRAVDAERSRIARELHDVVAHAMSVMVIQAGGARRVIADRPDEAAEALEIIETTGRTGLVEMRRLLDVLRARADGAEGPELAPQPGTADLPALVASWDAAGLATEMEVTGDLAALPPGVDLAVFRLVQEALTNTFKHAGPARAHVAIAVDDEGVGLEISDDGRGAAATPSDTVGHGLMGMRERVALYGGSFAAGPAPGGGFVVHARLPISAGVS